MINYKQLYYFWSVAKSGGVLRAAERLHVTPQTVSGQLGELQESLGATLFRRVGRRLQITPAGELALARAEEIFQIGQELEMMLRNRAREEGVLFRVGVADAVPKSLAYRLLSATFALAEPVQLVCHEDKPEALFGALAVHKLDLVIADRPLPRELGVKGYNHELGRSTVTFCAAPGLAGPAGAGFPQSLQGLPLLLPGEGTALRGAVTHWLIRNQLQPRIVGEFDDMALLKAFGQAGAGVFPVPTAIAEEVGRQYGVTAVGCAEDAAVRFYAISQERRLKHPAVVAVSQAAKASLFTAEAVGKMGPRD